MAVTVVRDLEKWVSSKSVYTKVDMFPTKTGVMVGFKFSESFLVEMRTRGTDAGYLILDVSEKGLKKVYTEKGGVFTSIDGIVGIDDIISIMVKYIKGWSNPFIRLFIDVRSIKGNKKVYISDMRVEYDS